MHPVQLIGGLWSRLLKLGHRSCKCMPWRPSVRPWEMPTAATDSAQPCRYFRVLHFQPPHPLLSTPSARLSFRLRRRPFAENKIHGPNTEELKQPDLPSPRNPQNSTINTFHPSTTTAHNLKNLKIFYASNVHFEQLNICICFTYVMSWLET